MSKHPMPGTVYFYSHRGHRWNGSILMITSIPKNSKYNVNICLVQAYVEVSRLHKRAV